MNRRSAIRLLNFTIAGAFLGAAPSAQAPAPSTAAATSPANAWRQFRGSPQLTGNSSATPPATLEVLWTFKTGSEIKSSPVVVGDLVLMGSYDGHLYGLDAKTGKPRWKVMTDGQVHSTPAVQNGLAFIAGCDSKFRAIRITDGRQMFMIDSGAYTGASPVLDGERAYFGTFDNEVLALNLRTRRIQWRYVDPETRFPYYSSGALVNGRVVLGGRDKIVRALDAATGKEAWRFLTRARVDSSPVVAAGRIYIGSSDGKLYVLDAGSGKKISEFDAGAGLTASPAVADGKVIIGSQDGTLYALG